MSYRPPEEDLSEPIDALLEALSLDKINDLREVVKRRENTVFDKYTDKHIKELHKTLKSLDKARRKLKEIR